MRHEKQKRLTSLNNSEATEFLKKYERIIFLEANKRSQLVGLGIDDLMQVCREKLLAGYDTYDNNKSSEKTWAVHVIKNTLDGIWNRALKKKRVSTTLDEEKKEKPLRDISFSDFKEEYNIPIAFDGRPIFGTESFSPEEYLIVLEALSYLKTHLPKKSYELVKRNLLPDLEEKIPVTIKKTNYKLENPNDYKIWSIFSNIEENEVRILSQIADFFTNVLGFERKRILGRTKTIDLPTT